MKLAWYNKEKEKIRLYALCNIICFAVFIVLISNELTNTYDGLWQGSYYAGYYWVATIGRWFWPVIGELRLNISPEPFTTMASLALFILGSCLVAWWTDNFCSIKKYGIVLISVLNTAVCVSLSYRFMSPTFACSYLFSILSIFLIRKQQSIWRTILAIICLTLSLGSYQACLGISCLLVLLNMVMLLQREDEKAQTSLKFFASAIMVLLISCIVYKITWDLVMQISKLTASNYRGADSISVLGIFRALPKTIPNAYKIFFEYFFSDTLKHSAYQGTTVFKIIVVMVFVGFWGLGLLGVKRIPIRLILYVVCMALVPLAVNAAYIVAPDSGTILMQQTLPMAVVIPFLLCIVKNNKSSWIDVSLKRIMTALLMFIFVGNILMVSVDQHVMLVTKEASISLINRVVQEIDLEEEPLDGYIFLGSPSDNQLFRKDELFWKANDYARYGSFFKSSTSGYAMSYDGLLRDAGINLKLNWNKELLYELERDSEVLNMPVYPQNGSIVLKDNIVIIKIADD